MDKKLVLVTIVVYNLIVLTHQAINWNNNWSFSCDFKGNDLSDALTRGEDCGPRCESTSGCTHFTWTKYNGGTCWMKKGPVSKNDAFDTNDNSMVCGVTGKNENPGGPGDSGDLMSFRVINRCSFTIWPGIQGRSRSNPGWIPPYNGGWELGAGQTTVFSLPRDYDAGRIWARTNCRDSNGLFVCDTGSCDFRECAKDGIQRGGKTPASLAEFTLNGSGNQDFYDVSLVDGYNLQIQIQVRKPNSDGSGQYWCKNPGCTRDLNSMCPEEPEKKKQCWCCSWLFKCM